MAKIMTKCPVTGHAISTGVEVDSDGDFNFLFDVAYHIDCPCAGITTRVLSTTPGSQSPPHLGKKTPMPRDGVSESVMGWITRTQTSSGCSVRGVS